MNAKWLLAKYMDDPRRREPRNVGIILLTDHGAFLRFRGEDSDGSIDGRKVTPIVKSHENYKGWVSYWHRAVKRGDPMRLLEVRGEQNYFLEFGGERLLGNDELDPCAFRDRLYQELVEDDQVRPEATGSSATKGCLSAHGKGARHVRIKQRP